MKKDIFVRETEKGIHITGPSGTVYTSWYFDNLVKPELAMKTLFYELKEYQDQGYKIIFERLSEEELDKRFSN